MLSCRAGTARINACGDSRLRGRRSRKPIGFRQWVVHQRTKGKLVRNSETGVIKKLIQYAQEQGSTHADKLYMTYTKLANKMVGISNRDLSTFQQLSELSFIENIILNQIHVGMEKGLHYKEIYKDCKRQIELFKDIAYLE